MECLGSDVIIDLFCSVAEPSFRKLLLEFGKAFCQNLEDNPLWEKVKACKRLWPVQANVARFEKFMECVNEMLQADDERRSYASFMFFMKYKGLDVFEKTICNVLTKPERQDAAPGSIARRRFIHEMVEDTVRTAASTKLLEPDFMLSMDKMQAEGPSVDDLVFVDGKLDEFNKGLRSGRAVTLLKLFREKLLSTVERVQRGELTSLSADEVDSLVRVLQKHSRVSEILDAMNSLVAWIGKHNNRLYQEKLCRLVKQYLDGAAEGISIFKIADFQTLKQVVSKSDGNKKDKTEKPCVNQELMQQLPLAVFNLLHQGLQEAASVRWTAACR